MKEHIGTRCRIVIEQEDKDVLYFSGKVTEVTQYHISFIDKFDIPYTFRIADVQQIKTLGVEDEE